MNQPNRGQIGHVLPLRILKASQVNYPHSDERLAKILGSFNDKDLLITLARINFVLQRSEDFLTCETKLKKSFCSRWLREEIDWQYLNENFLFNRESTLDLLNNGATMSSPRSARAPESTIDAMNELAACYLIANERIYYEKLIPESSDFSRTLTKEQKQELLAESIPSWEYRVKPAPWPHIKRSLVRAEYFLVNLQQDTSAFDVNETFCQATGLTLHDYQYLILSILRVTWSFSSDEIAGGKLPCVDLQPSPDLAGLYEKLLQHICVPFDKVKARAASDDSLPSEFRMWRRHPIVKLCDSQIFCIDIGFLMDKLETGVFWLIRNQLKGQGGRNEKDIFDLRGPIFENYTSSIIQRGINSRTPSHMESYIVKPKYIQKVEAECTDIAVIGSETLILLECKAPILTAKMKFSRDFCRVRDGIEDNALDGIKQLWNAIESLAHIDEEKMRRVKGIEISTVKEIYPVLVLSDPVFSVPFMNWFLDSEFQQCVNFNVLKKGLKIKRLTVITIDNLETLEPYLRDTPFHAHLDKWLQIFDRNESLPFSEYLRSLREIDPRENPYIEQEFKRIQADIMEYFTSRGVE